MNNKKSTNEFTKTASIVKTSIPHRVGFHVVSGWLDGQSAPFFPTYGAAKDWCEGRGLTAMRG